MPERGNETVNELPLADWVLPSGRVTSQLLLMVVEPAKRRKVAELPWQAGSPTGMEEEMEDWGRTLMVSAAVPLQWVIEL